MQLLVFAYMQLDQLLVATQAPNRRSMFPSILTRNSDNKKNKKNNNSQYDLLCMQSCFRAVFQNGENGSWHWAATRNHLICKTGYTT